MLSISFFMNSSSLASISFVKAQLEFFDPTNCELTLLTEPLTSKKQGNLKKSYFQAFGSDILGVHEQTETDILCFTISKVCDLTYLDHIPKVKQRIIVVVPYDLFLDSLFHFRIQSLRSLGIEVILSVRYGDDYYVLSLEKDDSRSKPRFKKSMQVAANCEFFGKVCWLPLFLINIDHSSTLYELHFHFLEKLLEGQLAEERAYSDIYLNKLKLKLPGTKLLEKLVETTSPNLLKQAYLDFLLNKKHGYLGHQILLGRGVSNLSSSSFVDIHSSLDPVNSIGLSASGIQFFKTSPLSRVLFKTYDRIRLEQVSNSRIIPDRERALVITFVLARYFPKDVSEKSNSHYNVLKLFSALVHHHNTIQNEANFRVKVLVTNEKSFATPFGVKDSTSHLLFEANQKLLLRDGIIKSEDDLINAQGDTKNERIESAVHYTNELSPFVSVFLGGTYDSKVARTAIYKDHPVAFLPTTSTIDNAYGIIDKHLDAVRSVSVYHSKLIASCGVPREKIVHFSKPMFEKLELALTSWSWPNLPDVDKPFFVATPLVGGRIVNWLSSLSERELAGFIAVFEKCPSLVWVPIGAREYSFKKVIAQNERLLALLDKKLILPIEFTKDLGSLLQSCDAVFIPTLGGATTVASATSLDVVSVVDKRSDSNTIVPSIGQFDSFSDAFNLICRIYHDKKLSNEILNGSKVNLAKRFDIDTISRDFVKFLEKANLISLGSNVNKLLILGAGVYQVPLIEAAKKRNLEVHVVSPEGNYPGIDVCDVHVNIDTTDHEKVLRYCIDNEISGITTSGTDVAVKSIGYVVDNLGLPGPSFASAKCTTNKVEMKKTLSTNNIPTAKFEIVRNQDELESAVRDFSFPVMVKAVDTSGSRGIVKVEKISDLRSAFDNAKRESKDDRIIVEEFLDGIEFGAQVVVVNDEVLDVIIHGDIVTSPPVCVPVGHYLPYEIDDDLFSKSVQLAKDTVRALGVNSAICNFDLMLVNNEPYIIEVGSRMGATCLPENIGYYHDIDYYDLLIDISLGVPIEYKPSPYKKATVSRLLTSSNDGVFSSFKLPEVECEGYIIDVHLDVKEGDIVKKFINGTHRFGHIVVSGELLSECNRIMNELLDCSELELVH